MRIIAVVLLHIPPETMGHELIGLCSFLTYSIAPIYFFIKKTTSFSFFFREKMGNQAFFDAQNKLTNDYFTKIPQRDVIKNHCV